MQGNKGATGQKTLVRTCTKISSNKSRRQGDYTVEWITQENEFPLSELPNHVRTFRELVTIFNELQRFQRKFR